MIKKLSFSLVLALLSVVVVNAQSMGHTYKTALGLRGGYNWAPTFKTFINNKAAVEGIAFIGNNVTQITGLYEVHNDIKGAEGLKWYYGGGATLGMYKEANESFTTLGINGALGLDYKINNAPINLSIDWLPQFNFNSNYGFMGGSWGGLAVRYTF